MIKLVVCINIYIYKKKVLEIKVTIFERSTASLPDIGSVHFKPITNYHVDAIQQRVDESQLEEAKFC